MPLPTTKSLFTPQVLLRVFMFVMAYAHTFPARKHALAFAAAPSLDEAWKAGGAIIAVALYLAPPQVHARALRALHRNVPVLLRIAGVLLAVAHLVPALDHVPRFVSAPSFADGWRGLGALAAAMWFVLPLQLQSWALCSAFAFGKRARSLTAGAERAKAHS